jgi:hypothetical protein
MNSTNRRALVIDEEHGEEESQAELLARIIHGTVSEKQAPPVAVNESLP